MGSGLPAIGPASSAQGYVLAQRVLFRSSASNLTLPLDASTTWYRLLADERSHTSSVVPNQLLFSVIGTPNALNLNRSPRLLVILSGLERRCSRNSCWLCSSITCQPFPQLPSSACTSTGWLCSMAWLRALRSACAKSRAAAAGVGRRSSWRRPAYRAVSAKRSLPRPTTFVSVLRLVASPCIPP